MALAVTEQTHSVDERDQGFNKSGAVFAIFDPLSKFFL
jgi:hypothetical protein